MKTKAVTMIIREAIDFSLFAVLVTSGVVLTKMQFEIDMRTDVNISSQIVGLAIGAMMIKALVYNIETICRVTEALFNLAVNAKRNTKLFTAIMAIYSELPDDVQAEVAKVAMGIMALDDVLQLWCILDDYICDNCHAPMFRCVCETP